MAKRKVRLSLQGQDYIRNSKCSTTVRSVLKSIDLYSAEILDVEDSIVRVRIVEETIPEEFKNLNNFAIHRDHLVLY